MRCLNPLRLKNPQYPSESSLRFIDCACGKCYNCLVNRRRSWFFRLSYHALYNDGSSYFISLDYAPAFNDKHLHKSHLRNFVKRLRHYQSFKYYAIGEFGTDPKHDHNPHYHLLCFFDNVLTEDYVKFLCSETWRFGRVDVGYVDPASINYVLHYHVRPKNPFGEDDERKTFATYSQGLGLPFLDCNITGILKKLSSSLDRSVSNHYGDTFVLPRYYVKKLREYGVSVMDFDGSAVDWSQSNLRDAVSKIDSSILYEPDGRPKEEYEERFCSIMYDLIKDSKRKLSKYNHQEKF